MKLIFLAMLAINVVITPVFADDLPSKMALQGYFAVPTEGRNLKTWHEKSSLHVEVSTDYGLLGVSSLRPDDEIALWDALFLIKLYADVDNVDTPRFGSQYGDLGLALAKKYTLFKCQGHSDPASEGICIVRHLAGKYSLHFFTITTDEGHRCRSELSRKDFRTPSGSRKCTDLRATAK